MHKSLKYALWFLLFAVVTAGAYSAYRTHVQYNFTEVAPGRVYSSAVIPPDEIGDWVRRHGIRTVIDLRKPGTEDLANNPEAMKELDAERVAVGDLPGVRYVSVPSLQVPDQAALDGFFKVMDDPVNYPVLIHCHHGVGRAVLYSALYRIEYENMSPADARSKTRLFPQFSSFADGKEKGDFLMHYVPRNQTAGGREALKNDDVDAQPHAAALR